MGPCRKELLSSAQQFCEAFSRKEDITNLLSHFSTTHQISAIEHGEPSLAPFLGKSFSGTTGVQSYFEMISSLLSYENMTFSEFVVDTEARKVALKGNARFTWIATAERWEETFAYMLDFDEEGKVAEYQVWADSGAAYLARIGKLKNMRLSGDFLNNRHGHNVEKHNTDVAPTTRFEG
ncbi:hypothetical protein BDZ94DRAFT_1208065 [Collybia nuda]|uniref:SnoaL-like domain-containing protein n=1 Tax=Collybia nuda TaxID=64659 RepID=A0A9P5YFB3_9AGAR|nr:hypothetical protein BDZ94DRAFT_1208065 [Collybia nuda]